MIQLCNLTKKYGDTVILEDTSYTFPAKGIVCLMGASGGGKTTLLNLLAGFDTDYSGKILVGGTDIHTMDMETLCNYRRDNVGFVFQNYHLLTGYTVLENVCLASTLSGRTTEDGEQTALSLLSRLGISDKKDQKAEDLSGGQKQRVAIARALLSDPKILFADEPTGALDRTTSTEIMNLLQEISKERLVVLITHDPKICAFADEVLHIKNRKIDTAQTAVRDVASCMPLTFSEKSNPSTFSRAAKNFKVHAKQYMAVSLAISIGLLAFLLSLSFSNVMGVSIESFKDKNTAFNNGYIRGIDDGTILNHLTEDRRIENIYYQYRLKDISLRMGDKTESMTEKFPMPKATESLSYGIMPRMGMNEIALSPSLAKKFDSNLKDLLGKTVTMEFDGQTHKLSISGIYNVGYDDFFVSSDVEQQLYQSLGDEENYSISYDVKDFSDIIAVSNSLALLDIDTQTAAKEVSALQNTFNTLGKLFLAISVLVLGIGVFICGVLLGKLQKSRFHEVGLLSALGFQSKQIGSMIHYENILLSVLSTVINLLLLGGSAVVCNLLDFALIIGAVQVLSSVVASFAVVMVISYIASYKLLRTEPADALRR